MFQYNSCHSTMECRYLNESTYNKIESFLEGPKYEKTFPCNYFYKSVYSPATLINNWSEERMNVAEQEVHNEPMLSEHMEKFRKVCVSNLPDRREYFNKIFEGYGYGQELLIDHQGFSYYGNYVSTYDLSYNHLVKGICGPYPRHYFKGEYKPSTDLSLIYGNLTQWGLRDALKRKVQSQVDVDLPTMSESKCNYVHHDLSEVKKINNFPVFKKVKAIY